MDSVLNKTINNIVPSDKEAVEKAEKILRHQARPAGSLGRLEEIAAKLAGIKGCHKFHFPVRRIITCAGDHGVVEEKVSLFPQDTTRLMVENFVEEGASINILAKEAGAKVVVADLGVNCEFSKDLPIFHKKVAMGTSNFTKEPAMTRAEAILSIENGISIVDELIREEKPDLLGTGDMGIGNTTPSAAIIAAFSGVAPAELTGRGTGLDDEGLKNKISVIKRGLELNEPDPSDPLDVLAKVGGFEIGGLAGVVLAAAANKIPVICDGLISTAGALIAYKLNPNVKDYLFAGHKSVEAGHQFMHREIGIEPVLDLGMRLGEGTGAAIAMQILSASARVLGDIKSFEETSIEDSNR